jgi:C4-dicarboxylate-specific signal transduction histidine kinase
MHKFVFSYLPIRMQLILLAILLSLPALGIIIYAGLKDRKDDYRKAVVETQILVDNLAEQQKDLLNEAQQIGGFLAELPEVRNRTTDKVQSIIRNTIKRNPQFVNIIITDDTGMVWASAVPFSPPLSLAERRHFKSARETKRFSSGEYVIGSIAQQPIFGVAYPLIEHDIFQGVVVIGFDLNVLKTTLSRSQLPADSNYILVDHKGIIITRGIEVGRNVGESIQPADLVKMEKGPDRDTYEFVRNDGDRRIVSYRKLRLPGEEEPYMYVRGGMSIKSAVARANRQLLYNIGMLVPFVLCALILAIIIGKRSIVDRVKLLETASKRIAGGDLNTRVGDQLAGGELGELGLTFDEMARILEKNISELQHSHHQLHEKTLQLETENSERQIVQQELADKQQLLEALNRTLEKRIDATVNELRQKDLALIQQNRLATMGEMISNIAHQWRQPLNLISLIVQGLPDCKNTTPAELDKEVERIMDVVMHMSQTIDDFRCFFRQDKEKTRFTANQAVAKAVEFIRPSLTNRGIAVSITEQPEVQVFGYTNEYAQVLLNILNNAKDVLVDRNVTQPHISITISKTGETSVVTITDNGGGISPDVMPRIFDPYFSTKEQMQGTGIGLYMSKIIIEQNMGGHLSAENVDSGVAFRIEV